MPDSDKAQGRVDCPECDAEVLVKPGDTASPASAGPIGRGRSLWAVMGQQGDTASKPADEKTEPTAKEGSFDPLPSTKNAHAHEKSSDIEPPKPSIRQENR